MRASDEARRGLKAAEGRAWPGTSGRSSIKELTNRAVPLATIETDLRAVLTIMREEGIDVVPVVDNQNRLVGVVTNHDIAASVAAFGRLFVRASAGEVMSQAARVGADDDVREVLLKMRRWRLRSVAVTDSNNRPAGILSLADIVRATGPLDRDRADDPALCQNRQEDKQEDRQNIGRQKIGTR